MKILLSFVLLFGFSVINFGQVKTVKKPLIITTDAVTRDGKAVILKSDGTWEYNGDAPVIPNSTSSTISIESGIVYRSGEVMPVSRTKFYLLSESARKALDKPELKEKLLNDANKTSPALALRAKNPTQELLLSALGYKVIYPTYADAGLEAIEKVKKFEAVSDFQGKVSFEDIPKGVYYLFVISETRRSIAVWDLEVNADKNAVNVVIDQNNAIVVL